MKYLIQVGLILLIIFFYSVTHSQGSDNPWIAFINEPNVANYNKCHQQIKDVLKGISLKRFDLYESSTYLNLMEPLEIGKKYPNSFGKLLILIEKGNQFALSLGFQLHPLMRNCPPCVEELDVTLGSVIRKDPIIFLQNLKKNRDHIVGLDGLLGNYGDEFVDEFELKINETQKRIDILQSIQEADLIDVRDECVKNLKEYKKNLKNIQSTTNSKK